MIIIIIHVKKRRKKPTETLLVLLIKGKLKGKKIKRVSREFFLTFFFIFLLNERKTF